jgi:hypothetical protein
MENITKFLSRVYLLIKRYFINLLNRFINLICYDSLIKQFNMTNIASIIFILYLIYKFYMSYNNNNMDFIKLLAIMISFSLSFCFSMFVLDKFTFSDNRIIRFIQKLILYVGIPLVVSIVGIGLFSETVNCSSPDDNNNNNKFNFSLNLDSFYAYLDSLTLLEESALLHIFIFIFILLTLFNLISILFVNEIIKYFKLEDKHPYLNKVLTLRLKFQKYYLILNFIILILVCLGALFLNLFILK